MDKVLERFFTKQSDGKGLRPDIRTQSEDTSPLNTAVSGPKGKSTLSPKMDKSNTSFNYINTIELDNSGTKDHGEDASSAPAESTIPVLTTSTTSVAESPVVDMEGTDSKDTKEPLVNEVPEESGLPHGETFRFYKCAPKDSRFIGLIAFLSGRGMRHTCDQPAEFCSKKEKMLLATYLKLDFITLLCDAAINVFKEEENVLEVNVESSETLIVVGDIHGQFNDLYTSILVQQYSPDLNPSRESKKFLFLGDFVDRGPHSLDVILLVLALKVEYPHLIYVTRGNHEESKTSRVYGFLTEMQAKLGDEGFRAWSKINSVFPHIPLCAVVTTPHLKIFATHGGLSPALLDQISTVSRVDRKEYCNTLRGHDEDIVNGLLWSDPTTDVGFYDRNPRGCGVLFGPSASATFCEKNGLDFICRAHQVVTEGFLWRHNNKVVTVFSAPNYCGINGNLGAVMEVKGSSKSPTFVQYECFEDLIDWQAAPSKNFPYASCFM
ncbi:protein phosphatase [Angomonas deanei]|uniref:Calcineurin-like phosphoesterase, putative n=1 Tax=Angomonas deanei TaxID=59799 RepID=A0A7G2CL69_9TRYP|nr:protein phosphatase [Angomonas deanei]CAD2219671.1 Calcineurin-like phosphoesterase, putative [Angomonas deanei]|eukprot:EPY21085.1 protein phosphatase [Angomonas deanei]